MSTRIRVVAVVGPTGVGKTRVGEELALRLDGEVVGADSMQVYSAMDVGTAKPPPEERRVPYHCIDLVGPGRPYSAALYQKDARDAIADIASRGKTPVMVGGTGLYVRAALDDWEFPPGHQASTSREQLEALAAEIGPERLHGRLAEVDPAAAALIHPNNVRRVVRALEMAGEGFSYSAQAERFAARASVFDVALIGLTRDRDELYERIGRRVEDMVSRGLLAEVNALLRLGFRDALTASQAIGYKELVPVLEEGADLAGAIDDVKRATRHYAKRQLTWFRADPRVRWIDMTGKRTHVVVGKALALASETGRAQGGPRVR